MVVGFHLLTLQAFQDEMDYIAFHAYPKEDLPHICVHLLHSQMCTIKCSMGFLRMILQISPFSGMYILPRYPNSLSISRLYPSYFGSNCLPLWRFEVTFKYQLSPWSCFNTCSLRLTFKGTKEKIHGLLLKASVTTFSFPLMYDIPKSYSLINSLHHLFLAFRSL